MLVSIHNTDHGDLSSSTDVTCPFFLCRPQATPPILSDATLTYEIQLLAVRDGPNVTNMSDDERLKIGYGN